MYILLWVDCLGLYEKLNLEFDFTKIDIFLCTQKSYFGSFFNFLLESLKFVTYLQKEI